MDGGKLSAGTYNALMELMTGHVTVDVHTDTYRDYDTEQGAVHVGVAPLMLRGYCHTKEGCVAHYSDLYDPPVAVEGEKDKAL